MKTGHTPEKMEDAKETLEVGWCACNYSEGDTYDEVTASGIVSTFAEAQAILAGHPGKYEGIRYVHTDGYLYVDAQ